MTTRSTHRSTRRRPGDSPRQPAMLRIDAWIALIAMACYIYLLS
ncbi:hypothetical protein JCM15519_28870 [Fundidesulfovibrio butyratiphilus]